MSQSLTMWPAWTAEAAAIEGLARQRGHCLSKRNGVSLNDSEDVGCSRALPSTKPASREPVEARHLHGHGTSQGAEHIPFSPLREPILLPSQRARFHRPSLGAASAVIWAAPTLRRRSRRCPGSVLRRSAEGPWTERPKRTTEHAATAHRSRRGCHAED